jgi:anti-anti-sigma regulatory factor
MAIKKQRKKLNISNLLAPIISSRDVADILEKIIKKTNIKSVDLDFSDVKFISRSAAHALSLMKEKFRTKKDISLINTNEDVTNMLRIVVANRIVSKTQKPQFNPQKIDINSLLKEVLA